MSLTSNYLFIDSSSKDQSHVQVSLKLNHLTSLNWSLFIQENSNPNDPNFQDVEPTWIHVSNLVRPYALTQLKQLLCEHGPYIEKSFWVDNIKSHCFVQVTCLTTTYLMFADHLFLVWIE